MKLLTKVGAIGVLLLAATFGATAAFAAPYDWHTQIYDETGITYYDIAVPRVATGTPALVGNSLYDNRGIPSNYYFGDGFFIGGPPIGGNPASQTINLNEIGQEKISGLQDSLNEKASIGSLSVLQAQVDQLSAHGYTIASSTSRSIVTGTGATGFQVSTTTAADVHYSATIVTTANIAGSSQGTVVLEVAPTNSATSTAWIETGRCTNGQSLSLAIALQSVQTSGCQISAFVPAGYWVKLRSIATAGTPTFTFNSGQEVLH